MASDSDAALDSHRAVAVVESLRAGIPTRASTRALPDLRPELSHHIRADLEQLALGERPPGRLIWGAYGQGKTHALTSIEHEALDRGFAVSRLSLNREVSCQHLFNFYARAATALRTPDSRVPGIQHLLDKKRADELSEGPFHQAGRYAHDLPLVVLENYFSSTGEEQDRLYGDLTGTRLAAGELKRIHRANRGEALRFESNFRVNQHASAYLGVMADTLAWCGYRGWVILIDEVELVGRLATGGRLQAYRNLQWLLNWSPQQPMPYPIYTVGGVATRLRDDVWSGLGSRGDREQIPVLAAQKICDDVGNELRAFFARAVSNHCPIVEPLPQERLVSLLMGLASVHGLAHDWQAKLDPAELVAQLGNRPLRTYIRAAIEQLDIAFVYQRWIPPEVTGLIELSVAEDADFFKTEEPAEDGEAPSRDRI